MRTLLFMLLMANAALAQQRTWTITTAVTTAEAELVGVRGDVVYLKVGDKIESVPLARLSVADHDYLASVSLAPVRLGAIDTGLVPPQGQGSPVFPNLPGAQPEIVEEAIPLPGNAGQQATTTPAVGMTANPENAAGRATAARRGGPQSTTRTNTATSAQRRGATTTTVRRPTTSPTSQTQSGPRGNANTNETSGILGIRDRRDSRQRGR
jgi:hypothetical protein